MNTLTNAPDNESAGLAYFADSLQEQGLDTFEIALRLTAPSNIGRVRTVEEVKMEVDMLTSELAHAYIVYARAGSPGKGRAGRTLGNVKMQYTNFRHSPANI